VVEADARLIPLIRRTLKLNGVSSGVDVECAILTEDAGMLRKGSASFIVAEHFWNSRISESGAGPAQRPFDETTIPHIRMTKDLA
jgi:hypothetical protein